MKPKPLFDVKNVPGFITDCVRVVRLFHGGSRVTVTPPPTDTDDDYVLLIEKYGLADMKVAQPIEDVMIREGFMIGGSKALNNAGFNKFQSWKRGDLNIILTYDAEWYEKMLLATKLCCELNLKDKAKRIKVFEAIVYGIAP